MKKIIFISIILAIVVIGGLWIWKSEKIIRSIKYYCEADSDCVISGSDPEGFGTCVNKNWNKYWEINPKSIWYTWGCILTGEEKCSCINNKCQRTDSESGC